MYESDTATVTTALRSGNTAVFTDDTISKILALTTVDNATTRFDNATPDAEGNVTVATGAEVVFVTTSDTAQTTIKPPVDAPVVIFQGKGGVDVTFNDAGTPTGPVGTPERIVVGSSGNDKIVISDAKNTQVTLGTGNSTVEAGAGHDTVEAGLGNSTVVGGEGNHTIVKLAGAAADYTVTVVDGHAVVTNVTGPVKTTDISHVQFVQLANNEALVFAKDTTEAAVANLFHATFGRDADAGGLEFWFDAAKSGKSLEEIAKSFTDSAEYKALGTQTDAEFLDTLYQNAFGRAGDAEGVDFWTDLLDSGLSRAEVMASFANVGALNDAGELNTETTVVGSVTVVHGIV
jgi:Ca2+-binding RTX toxin-like protein